MRLIDADRAIEIVHNQGIAHPNAYHLTNYATLILREAPTVDAVEVVRCKDCKHYKPQKKSAHWENRTNYCNRIVTIKVQPYDFCTYGERKDGDGNDKRRSN